jgi:hypothetical protein
LKSRIHQANINFQPDFSKGKYEFFLPVEVLYAVQFSKAIEVVF